MREAFLQLVRLGVGISQKDSLKGDINWAEMRALAEQQGLTAVAMDGIDRIPKERRPQKKDILQWIGATLQQESQYAIHQKTAEEMALIFHANLIRTYVLKGSVVSECYPNPIHRYSSDLDCFLLPVEGNFDAWLLGNNLMKANGYCIETVFYKNSTFFLPGLMVENHQFITPFRGNETLKNLEKVLQAMLLKDMGTDRFEGTWLYRPPVMVTALFLIEHAYSHFLHEGLTWRHILDWMMFKKMHYSELDWEAFFAFVDEFGFRRFYDSFYKLGRYLLGEISIEELNRKDLLMLEDIWAPLDINETARGLKGKIALAGNTWRARWKYHYFGDISMFHALWIQVKGVLFERHPKLD